MHLALGCVMTTWKGQDQARQVIGRCRDLHMRARLPLLHLLIVNDLGFIEEVGAIHVDRGR